MWQKISLRYRIYLILTALVLITLMGGLTTVWYTYRMEVLLTAFTEKDLGAYETAGDLMATLANQKGFVSYYFLDGNPYWLERLEESRRLFSKRLNAARALAGNESGRKTVNRIESEYIRYTTAKNRVISFYKAGKRAKGTKLHEQVRRSFVSILELCRNYKNLLKNQIIQARTDSHIRAVKLRIIATTAMFAGFFLAILVAFVFVWQILEPVRRLTGLADRTKTPAKPENEVKALSRSVTGLIQDIDQTQDELEKSRESLLQAEKMALVGKLAAGMAHSIRNPFTSIKMRLFSLSRSLEFSDAQKEDSEVIAEEIRNIDTIIENFLEFSRPPKLKMQRISPSTVIDHTIRLLEYRLKSYNVSVQIERERLLPEIQGDPKQLKEVFVNIVVNSCEAMASGGSIVIREEEKWQPALGRVAVIRVRDSGPGIPEPIREKLFQPFFTTKEEGTGLGLSIAARIINEHHGSIEVEWEENLGATFIISLPIKEPGDEHNPDN